MKSFAMNLIFYLATLALLLDSADCLAQYRELKPHWRVHTDPATLTTTVLFFDAEQKLIYQESLPGKYFKLSEKNTRKLDQLLAQQVSQELIAHQVNLLELQDRNPPARKQKSCTVITNPSFGASNWTCQTFIRNNNSLFVWVNNPLKKALTLALYSDRGMALYSKRITYPSYRQRFHLSSFGRGAYQWVVTDDQGDVYYRNLLTGWPPKKSDLPPGAPPEEVLHGRDVL